MPFIATRRAAPASATLAALLVALGATLAAPPAHADILPHSGVPAPDWTSMFERTAGWTGADGVYTFPLSGNDRLGSGAGGRTFWIFSDTFVGNVNPDGSRASGVVMVNNTSATLVGNQPAPDAMQFNVRTDAAARPVSMVVPSKPNTWVWPNDGVVQGGKVYMTGLRMRTGDGGSFNFATDGMVWMTADASEAAPFSGAYTSVDAPMLYAPAAGKNGDMTFGVAVMALTKTAHAFQPDGYVYLYGVRNDANNKKMVVARVPQAKLLQARAYRYWNGSDWVADIAQSAPVADRMASEFSVTPLKDGRFVNVFQLDALSTTIAVRYGASPVGPWGPVIPVYTCPDTALGKNVYTYGAKAHPHLSADGQLLISYHVNSFSFGQNLRDASVYHPRFIKVPLN